MIFGIDSHSIIHRAYHAYPLSLITSQGITVNAAFGFTSMLLDVLIQHQPSHVYCAFDTPERTFRHEMYNLYKANRGPSDSDLREQFPIVKEILRVLNIPVFFEEGFEADDVLGTMSILATAQNEETTIVSGDKDLLQLVNDKVTVMLPRGSFKNMVTYNAVGVKKLLGVDPSQVIDLKGLMGDPSDNIPGVKGIGQKSALSLIGKFNNMDNIFVHLNEITGRQKMLLETGKKMAYLSKLLATIKVDMNLKLDLKKLVLQDFNFAIAEKLFRELEFTSLLKKLEQIAMPQEVAQAKKQTQQNKANEQLANLKKAKLITGDKLPQLKSVQRKKEQNLLQGLDLLEQTKTNYLLYFDVKAQVLRYWEMSIKIGKYKFLWVNIIDYLRVIIKQNKGDYTVLKRCMNICSYVHMTDLKLMKYILATNHQDYPLIDKKDSDIVIGNKVLNIFYKTLLLWEDLPTDKKRIKRWQSTGIKNDEIGENILHQMDLPLTVAVALLEQSGISLDKQAVAKLSKELLIKVEKLEKLIFEEVGHQFNVRSPKQLGQVLFDELNLPVGKKIKTGYSTKDSVLQDLLTLHPVVPLVIEYRTYYKFYSTYVVPFGRYKNKNLGQKSLFTSSIKSLNENLVRIHSTFNQVGTTTGRFSSANPNLQNLPIRHKVGKQVRELFVAPVGKKLLSLDYSQIDLRVVAELSQDQQMIKDFHDDLDIHRATASQVFAVPYDKVKSKQRSVAKAINFGIIYGVSPYGLASMLQISYKEAEDYINKYLENYSGVRDFMQDTIQFVKEHKYIQSMMGRRRYISGINVANPMVQNAAVREAINMPVQGGADDIMRLAMNKLTQYLLTESTLFTQIKLVLQIHDEFVFEIVDDSAILESFVQQAVDIMEGVVQIAVPLRVKFTVKDCL